MSTIAGFTVIQTPVRVTDDEIIVICDHEPRDNWLHLKPDEVKVAFENGTEIVASHIAVCDACFKLPVEDLEVHAARRAHVAQA